MLAFCAVNLHKCHITVCNVFLSPKHQSIGIVHAVNRVEEVDVCFVKSFNQKLFLNVMHHYAINQISRLGMEPLLRRTHITTLF